MEQVHKSQQKYSPFVTTQVLENQNCFLMQDDFIRNHYSQFNNMLYKYLDRKTSPSSFFRIFRIEEKVSFAYYWKSEAREPRSNRQGIYLILGVLCDYSVFCKEPLYLAKACLCLLNLIIEKYRSSNCTEIIHRIWKEESSNLSSGTQSSQVGLVRPDYYSLMPSQAYQHTRDIFSRINETFQFVHNQFMRGNTLQQYEKRLRFGICHLCLCIQSSSVEDIVWFFISEAANWICHPWGKMDIASIEGYGEWFINVRLNNLKLPKNMKQVKLLTRFNKPYLEIMLL